MKLLVGAFHRTIHHVCDYIPLCLWSNCFSQMASQIKKMELETQRLLMTNDVAPSFPNYLPCGGLCQKVFLRVCLTGAKDELH